MFSLRRVNDKVVGSIVGSVAIDVVDALGSSQRSADHLRGDDAMLHPGSRSHVALSRQAWRSIADVPLRQFVEGCKAAIVGAVATRVSTPVRSFLECHAASLADGTWVGLATPDRTTGSRASGDRPNEIAGDQEWVSADDARRGESSGSTCIRRSVWQFHSAQLYHVGIIRGLLS